MRADRKLLVTLVATMSLLATIGSASAANQRYQVYFRGRWVEYLERNGLAISEGDIVLGSANEFAAMRDAPPDLRKALAVTQTDFLWPPGTSGVREVPYTYEAGSNVSQAIASFNATFVGVIQWVPRTTQSDYVAFNLTNLANNQSGSCYSALGRVGGRQEIGGNADCLVWQLLHEMGHAIGLYHTHQAKSAQQFVQVSRAMIDPVRRYLYDPIFDSAQFDGHDYMSVMHYEYHDSSVTPDIDTMSSIPAGIDLGNHTGYSAADIDAIRRLYSSPAATVIVATNPPGLDVVVDGQQRTTPITLDWKLGSSHLIDVPAQLQTRDGFKFAFGRWSHDGSPTPNSAQRWVVEPEIDLAGHAANFPKVGVLTANFVRLLDIQPYLTGGAFGLLSIMPEVAAWPGTQSFYPQLTKFTLTANANAGYLNYWYWEAANTLAGGAGGASQASLRVRADVPTQKVGGGFFAAPGVVIQVNGPGVDGSLRSTITFPDNSQKSVALPWAFKTPVGTYKVSVPAIIARSESVRFVLLGIDGLDNTASGTITTPTTGQGTKIVTVKMEKQFQPVIQVNPTCAGTITLSNPEQWYPVGTVFSASASPVGGAVFTGWSGTATGSNSTVSVMANDVPELIANFNSLSEPFTLSSVTPAQYVLGQGQATVEIAGTGFTQETYAVINNAITRWPQFVNSRLLRLALSDTDFPARGDISLNLGTHVAGNCYGFTAALGVTPARSDQASKSVVYEYYNPSLDHYFITWVPDEITKLDNGTFKGWTRTGKSFAVFTASQPATSAVCRIYIPPGKGDGHYFGRDQTECSGTMTKNPTFVLEAPSFFHLYPPSLGNCAAGTVPVYRVFTNRADANHRYTTDRALRDQMVAKGWLAEGDGPDAVVMCAPQ